MFGGYSKRSIAGRNMDWINTVLRKHIQEKFYGKLTISFENGKIVLLKMEQTVKPPRD
jgi:hypothetical protein